MNWLLSAINLIWDSDTQAEERRHYPAVGFKYSSCLGREGRNGGNERGGISDAEGFFTISFYYLNVKLTTNI